MYIIYIESLKFRQISWRWIWWSRFDLKGNHRSIQTCCRPRLPIWLKNNGSIFFVWHLSISFPLTNSRNDGKHPWVLHDNIYRQNVNKRNSFREICVCFKKIKIKAIDKKILQHVCIANWVFFFYFFIYYSPALHRRQNWEKTTSESCVMHVDRSRRLTSSISTGEWERSLFFDSEMIVI